jgi:acylphosphatase
MPDSSVYIEAEGSGTTLSDFIAWCNTGPARAIVRKVETSEGPVIGFDDFQIR